jgi:hypothetical protein
MVINILAEVEQIKGSRLTTAELTAYQEMRAIGYANPYDIVKGMVKWN